MEHGKDVQALLNILESAAMTGVQLEPKVLDTEDRELVGCCWMGKLSDISFRADLWRESAEPLGAAAIAVGVTKRKESCAMGAEMARSYLKMLGLEPAQGDYPDPPSNRNRQLEFVGSAIITAAFNGLDHDETTFTDAGIENWCHVRLNGDDVGILLSFSFRTTSRKDVIDAVKKTVELGRTIRAAVDAGSHVSMALAVDHGSIPKIEPVEEK